MKSPIGFHRPNSLIFFVVRCGPLALLPGLSVSLLIVSVAATGLADTVDNLPFETRAELATASSVYGPSEVPAMDPSSASFEASTAQKYLQPDQLGSVYAVRRTTNSGLDATVSIIQSADPQSAAQDFATWREGASAAPWNGLGGPAMLKWKSDKELIIRTEGGTCQFAVEIFSTRENNKEAMENTAKTLTEAVPQSAQRFHILGGDQLLITYIVGAGAQAQTLAAGAPFHVSLNDASETTVGSHFSCWTPPAIRSKRCIGI